MRIRSNAESIAFFDGGHEEELASKSVSFFSLFSNHVISKVCILFNIYPFLWFETQNLLEFDRFNKNTKITFE